MEQLIHQHLKITKKMISTIFKSKEPVTASRVGSTRKFTKNIFAKFTKVELANNQVKVEGYWYDEETEDRDVEVVLSPGDEGYDDSLPEEQEQTAIITKTFVTARNKVNDIVFQFPLEQMAQIEHQNGSITTKYIMTYISKRVAQIFPLILDMEKMQDPDANFGLGGADVEIV